MPVQTKAVPIQAVRTVILFAHEKIIKNVPTTIPTIETINDAFLFLTAMIINATIITPATKTNDDSPMFISLVPHKKL